MRRAAFPGGRRAAMANRSKRFTNARALPGPSAATSSRVGHPSRHHLPAAFAAVGLRMLAAHREVGRTDRHRRTGVRPPVLVQYPRWTSSVEIRAGAGYGSAPFNVRQRISFSSAAGAASGAVKSSLEDWLAAGAFGGLTSVRGCFGTRAW